MDAQRRAGLAAWLIAIAACDCDHAEPTVEPPAEATARPVSAYFPLAPGDRWRTHVTPNDAQHVVGVTAVERATGHAIVFGTGRTSAERYRADTDEVVLVDPDGHPLSPVLRTPLRPGATFEYSVGDAQARAPCEARIVETGVQTTIAGVTLDDCVEITRECRYPQGQPFRAATTQRIDERFCRDVGRVRERMRFDPAPEGGLLPRERTEEVVWFVVAGAPRLPPPARFDCDSFLLLASDVAAACPGASGQAPVEGASGNETCSYTFVANGAPIEIAARRLDHEVTPEELEHSDTFAHGRYIVRMSGECPGLSRLEPLIRSLL